MKMKGIAGLAFFLNTVLFATYYAVAKEALGRIDPIIFTFFEMITLAPIALAMLAFTFQYMTWTLVKRGMLLGSCLCLALFTIAIALKYSTATGTAFFPALNGFLAAVIAWVVLRQPINKATWLAGLLSVAGTALLIANSEMGGVRGASIAFLGGLFFTLYVFISDNGAKELEEHKTLVHWPLLAIELLTMAVWAGLIALLFGDWQAFHPSFPKDALIILYVSLACTFLPTLIAVLMQKYISAVSISFIYILEPVLGAVVALFYLHEALPLAGYIGGGLVVVGAFIHTWGNVQRVNEGQQEAVREQHIQSSLITAYNSYIAPTLYCFSGFLILYGLGGFPPLAWQELAPLAPILDFVHPERRAMAHAVLNVLLEGPQRQDFLLLLVQALCWLIGWIVLAVFVCMALAHIVRQGSKHRVAGAPRMKEKTFVLMETGRRRRNEAGSNEAGRNELWPLQQDVMKQGRNTDDVCVDSASINAIWGGPLGLEETERVGFAVPYDVQEVITDELPPILPLFSTHRNSGEALQRGNSVTFTKYEGQKREELI